jgi:hypothetical protein
MIPGNGPRTEIKRTKKWSVRPCFSTLVTAGALAGCFAYLLSPPIPLVAVDQQRHLGKLTLRAPYPTAVKGPDWQPIENEKAATAYLEAAQAILRRAPTAQASASADEIPITGRIPLPRKRPIPRIEYCLFKKAYRCIRPSDQPRLRQWRNLGRQLPFALHATSLPL